MVFRAASESDGLEAQILCFGRVFAKSPKLTPFGVLMPLLCRVFRADAENHGLEAQNPCFGQIFAKSAKLAPFEVLMPFLCRVFRAEYENGGLEGRIPRRIKKNFETLATPENFLKSVEKVRKPETLADQNTFLKQNRHRISSRTNQLPPRQRTFMRCRTKPRSHLVVRRRRRLALASKSLLAGGVALIVAVGH